LILNFIETLTEQWLMKQGYLCVVRLPYWKTKEKLGKGEGGWGDLDVLAFKGDEVKLIECKTFLGTKAATKIISEIESDFEMAKEYILDHYPFLRGKKLSYLVVAESPKNLTLYQKCVSKLNMEVISFGEVIKGMVGILSGQVEPFIKVGKEEENMTRLLISLIQFGFLRID